MDFALWGKRPQLNSEGHDESEYLPHDVPVVNPFRERQGGVVWEGDAVKSLTWMPDILFERGKIERQHLDTSLCCFLCLMQTLQTLGMGTVRGVLVDPPLDLTQKQAVDTFYALLSGLAKPESNMLMWVIRDERNRGNVPLACHLIGTIKHALENARIIIDNLQEKRNLQDKSSPQSRPEFPATPVCERVF